MDETPRKRRVRYQGTHPKKFHEKYKELNPEKYSEEMEKVKARGMTPVGTHIPICVSEILEVLNPKPGLVFVDATLGYGGHTLEILKRVLPHGRLIAFDQDPVERSKTVQRVQEFLREKNCGEECFSAGAINFADAWNYLRQRGVSKVDGVLADLGLSSMQMDTPERGFSFKVESPLDLRMNPEQGVPARGIWSSLSRADLEDILRDHADEPRARQMAEALLRTAPQTTTELAETVRTVMKKAPKKIQEKEGDAPIRRVMQALRIYVNGEFSALEKFLAELPLYLKPGARVAILSFHSGEDRRVKKSFQSGLREGIYSEVSEDFIRPSMEEQRNNPRSKSAKLRWAQRA